jgi:hypothetical protein
MATTTPNFGWTVPTSTDLVKDGATAIETLGDSIDASFVDLKGGTTGQVLAKASGTDLDFSWVAQDDSNAIQNAIVDAKGDLIAATAADTPARLAVGTNGQVLTANSSAATGLAWATAASSGMSLITTQTLSGVTSQSVNSCFSSTYQNYIIVLNAYCATGAALPSLKLRVSGTDATSSYYSSFTARSWTDTLQSAASGNAGSWDTRPFGEMQASSTNPGGTYLTLFNPFAASNTSFLSTYLNQSTTGAAGTSGGVHNSATSYDGFTITNAYAMTGTIRVYGLAI